VGVIVVAWWVRRRRCGGAFGAVAGAMATFFARHREMAAVLVGAREGA